ncbi:MULTISPECIES: CobW family GTP-binding protein [Streptomyces]|uniref:GTP-binding protein n=1 Tax=Streptomyces morookaense TaxID=1970 RepID=A0A7Y7B677_STRMO|nr:MULTISPECIES: GTP-binding protein [Streptomyces]MCC2279998.1 GTP-binding protein [Streptomyces sp. ET3-23]NVK79798.1 GTP-binding protein [Streptomyces morookaense]GHF53161.1 cobalamin biosynthesis protein CobW [Streptomyces morookaense]
MAKRQIPVIVLAGFLGSGKTTLLNHLLSRSGGSRIGAVVNDFGKIEIDAMSIAGQVDSMVSLGNGCLCCAVDTSELDGFLEKLARPSARLDVIVIEASGLAEPQELIRMILASENRNIVYGGLVEVVDAAEFERTRATHPELDRHVAIADLVVLNKADRVADEARDRLLETLGELSPGTPVVPASYGRIDPELLFDRKPREDHLEAVRQLSFEDLCHGDHDHDGHLHAAYESVEFVSEEPMHPRRLMEFLDSRPKGLYRIKGFVHFGIPGHRQRFTVHAVGDFLRFYPSPWARGEQRLTQLVMIGRGVDAVSLRERLDSCRNRSAEQNADPNSMWGVLRYAQS